jgi:hypothetical protein
MDLSRRWRNLGVASGALAASMFAAFDVFQWVAAFASDHFHNDFTFYYAAARIGVNHGWQSIYDLALQQQELNAMGAGIKIAELARFISPPPVAWMALPLTLLPYDMAYWTWSFLLLAAIGWSWYLVAPGHGRARLIHLVAGIAWVPVIYDLQLSQPGPFVALGVAGCFVLLGANKPFVAGLTLGTLALKPQLGFLIPVALLVAGRYRTFAGAATAVGLLVAASAVNVGPSGIAAYQDRLAFAAGVPVNRELTLAPLIGDLTVTRVAQVGIAIWALALVYRFRRGPLELTFILAIVGGLLASPYLHLDDLVMLGLAAWLYLRVTDKPRWAWILVLGLILAAEGVPVWGPVPIVAGEIVALLLLSVAALKHHDRDPEHDGSEGKHDAGLERDRQHVAADRQAQTVDDRARQA